MPTSSSARGMALLSPKRDGVAAAPDGLRILVQDAGEVSPDAGRSSQVEPEVSEPSRGWPRSRQPVAPSRRVRRLAVVMMSALPVFQEYRHVTPAAGSYPGSVAEGRHGVKRCGAGFRVVHQVVPELCAIIAEVRRAPRV